ncbi:uncharacterized protein B0T15DRAFT_498383 [Chaetomium strumarium]|uniref:Uncharacterized protein n=1 Tax=Chaetomium strumarium TaxID=1170767 RepID=A0AAJ0M649_9PEZI|nr:hypothetical protein B0T15DRAFT_498383 [Chaetomium strumarium]
MEDESLTVSSESSSISSPGLLGPHLTSSPNGGSPESEGHWSGGTSIDDPPLPHQQERREVDGALVQFLIDYAAHDAECAPLFKAYLEEVVLKPGAEDLRRQVEYHLRNPEIRNYNLGETFLRELRQYTIYDQLYPESNLDGTLPSVPIPKQFQPRRQTSLGQTIVDLDELDSPGRDEDEDWAAEEERASNQVRPSGAARPRSTDALLRRLQSIRLLPRTEDAATIDTGQNGPDWHLDSWYRDRLEPPLAARLDTIVKFLADEDVDRCMGWVAKFEEVVSYLEWLAFDNGHLQLQDASPQTRAMFNDAVTKARAHALFERHHYAPTPLEITRPFKTPLKPTRLSWMVDTQDWPLPSHNPVPDRSHLLPRSIPPRPPSPVNRMLLDNPDDGPIFDQFVEDEKRWWQRTSGGDDDDDIPSDAEDDAERNNLAYIESAAFHGSAENSNNDPPSPRREWATDRGTRRAALQHALRSYATTITATNSTTTPHRRLILPFPASALLRACKRIDGPQWTPPRITLTPEQISQLDTMRHTLAYHARLAHIKRMRALARLRVEGEDGTTGSAVAVLLPRNFVNGGPFVWRMLDADAQRWADLLGRCRVVGVLLTLAEKRVPRALLGKVLEMVERGKKAAEETEDGRVEVPQEVKLARDEWVRRPGSDDDEDNNDEMETAMVVPRPMDPDELQWLRFLATGQCVNRKNWTGRFVPDTPREKYKLFRIFATRVQRLLDDANPEGLFSRHDAEVTVEELLAAINAGAGKEGDTGGGRFAVTRCAFVPSDACCWLDRMRKSGHVRFRLDLECYGVVRRPRVDFFPEHRVLWPAAADTRERPSYALGYVADWSSILGDDGRAPPDVDEGSAIWNFFASLGFRLGYTISMLEQEQQEAATPVRYRHLREAKQRWEDACAAQVQDTAEPTPSELALIRSNIISELSANETMLFPARERPYFDGQGRRQTTRVRDHNWDWAKIKTKAKKRRQGQQQRRQYWSINRWPLATGHLTADAERAVRSDAHVDPALTYDPAAQDLTVDRKYTRPKMKPYAVEKVLYRPGPAVYPVGDTRLQRQVIQDGVTGMVARAIGDLDNTEEEDQEEQGTWGGALARLNPFSRPSSTAAVREGDDNNDDGDARLPAVRLESVPRSWDPWEAERREDDEMAADGSTDDDDDDDDDDEEVGVASVGSVDVLMTGMEEPW